MGEKRSKKRLTEVEKILKRWPRNATNLGDYSRKLADLTEKAKNGVKGFIVSKNALILLKSVQNDRNFTATRQILKNITSNKNGYKKDCQEIDQLLSKAAEAEGKSNIFLANKLSYEAFKKAKELEKKIEGMRVSRKIDLERRKNNGYFKK